MPSSHPHVHMQKRRHLHTCAHICTFVHTHVPVCIQAHTSAHICTLGHMHISVYMHTCICTHVHICECVHTRTNIHVCMFCAHIHVCAHMHTYTFIWTQTYVHTYMICPHVYKHRCTCTLVYNTLTHVDLVHTHTHTHTALGQAGLRRAVTAQCEHHRIRHSFSDHCSLYKNKLPAKSGRSLLTGMQLPSAVGKTFGLDR